MLLVAPVDAVELFYMKLCELCLVMQQQEVQMQWSGKQCGVR